MKHTEQQDQILFDAVRAISHDAGMGVYPTRVYLIAEVVDDDGDEAIWASNTSIPPWSAVGMLESELVRLRMILEHSHFDSGPVGEPE